MTISSVVDQDNRDTATYSKIQKNMSNRNRMMLLVATQYTLATYRKQANQVVPVSGIDVELLDLFTRQAAAHLFPKKHVLLQLQLLFLQAKFQMLEIDNASQGEVAIIRLPSIEVFARDHRSWSKNTILRYHTLLEELQILRHTEYTELQAPLTPWSPSKQILAGLDEQIVEDAACKKLQQLALGVKARFLLLYGSPHLGGR